MVASVRSFRTVQGLVVPVFLLNLYKLCLINFALSLHGLLAMTMSASRAWLILLSVSIDMAYLPFSMRTMCECVMPIRSASSRVVRLWARRKARSSEPMR